MAKKNMNNSSTVDEKAHEKISTEDIKKSIDAKRIPQSGVVVSYGVEDATKKVDLSTVVASPQWSEKMKAKNKAGEYPRQY